jgi:hypothetical protein
MVTPHPGDHRSMGQASNASRKVAASTRRIPFHRAGDDPGEPSELAGSDSEPIGCCVDFLNQRVVFGQQIDGSAKAHGGDCPGLRAWYPAASETAARPCALSGRPRRKSSTPRTRGRNAIGFSFSATQRAAGFLYAPNIRLESVHQVNLAVSTHPA